MEVSLPRSFFIMGCAIKRSDDQKSLWCYLGSDLKQPPLASYWIQMFYNLSHPPHVQSVKWDGNHDANTLTHDVGGELKLMLHVRLGLQWALRVCKYRVYPWHFTFYCPWALDMYLPLVAARTDTRSQSSPRLEPPSTKALSRKPQILSFPYPWPCSSERNLVGLSKVKAQPCQASHWRPALPTSGTLLKHLSVAWFILFKMRFSNNSLS